VSCPLSYELRYLAFELILEFFMLLLIARSVFREKSVRFVPEVKYNLRKT